MRPKRAVGSSVVQNEALGSPVRNESWYPVMLGSVSRARVFRRCCGDLFVEAGGAHPAATGPARTVVLRAATAGRTPRSWRPWASARTPRSARGADGKKIFAMPLPFCGCSCHSSVRTGSVQHPSDEFYSLLAGVGPDQGEPSRSGVRVDDRTVIPGEWPALAGIGFDGVHRFSWVRRVWRGPGKGDGTRPLCCRRATQFAGFAVVVHFARRRTGLFASGSNVGRHLP